jgi:hypothetical protein
MVCRTLYMIYSIFKCTAKYQETTNWFPDHESSEIVEDLPSEEAILEPIQETPLNDDLDEPIHETHLNGDLDEPIQETSDDIDLIEEVRRRRALEFKTSDIDIMTSDLIAITQNIAGFIETAEIPSHQKQELANLLKGVPIFINKIDDTDLQHHSNTITKESDFLMQTLDALRAI